MRPYEVMLIFDASLEEETIRAAIDRFAEFIRSRGGNPGRVDRWGKRRFAYELRHRWEGYYVLMEFTAGVELEQELHRMLSLADEVVRHKVVRIPEAALKARAAPAAAPAAAEA
jgi:small subunit ribosomal protein S6